MEERRAPAAPAGAVELSGAEATRAWAGDGECQDAAHFWLGSVIARYVAELELAGIAVEAELPVAGVLTDLTIVAGLTAPFGGAEGARRLGTETVERLRGIAGGRLVELAVAEVRAAPAEGSGPGL